MMVLSKARVAAIAFAALFALGLPCQGQITDAEEVAIGKKMLAELAREGTFSVVHDEAAEARLKRVAEKIVKSAGRPGLEWAGGWQWLLVEFESGPNALALPGGFVLVDTRIVDKLQNDDILTFIVAHEAGHVVGRHLFRELAEQGTYLVDLRGGT